MTTFFVMRTAAGLAPMTVDDAAEMAKMSWSKAIRVEAKSPRNVNFHRLFFALAHRIASAVGCETENVVDLLKIESGHFTLVKSKKYGDLRLPKSISFASMTGEEFSTFFDACVAVIQENWSIPRPDILAITQDLLIPTEQTIGKRDPVDYIQAG